MSALLLSEALALWLIAALLVWLMLWQFLKQKADLLSMRNLFLIGFIVYQLISPAMTLFESRTYLFRIASLRYAGLEFFVKAVLFLGLFFFFYHFSLGTKKLAHKMPTPGKALSEQGMLVVAVTLAVLGALMIPLFAVPVVSFAALFISLGCATVSTGVIGWWWSQRQWNLVRTAIALGLIVANLASVMGGSFGRRPLLAIFGAVIWSFYFARVRYTPNRKRVIVVLLVMTVVPVFFASLFTSARSQDFKHLGSVQMAKHIFVEGNLKEGFVDLISGQRVGEATLWCIEMYPEYFAYDHLLSLRYVFVGSIPRAWWPEKPYVLSTRIADLADIEGVRQDRAKGGGGVTLPPGILGYAEAEGGLYALFVYALWMALMTRFLDEIVLTHVRRPEVVIPVAASLGNITGLARGDLAIFVTGAVWSIVAGFLLLGMMTFAIGYRVPSALQPEPPR